MGNIGKKWEIMKINLGGFSSNLCQGIMMHATHVHRYYSSTGRLTGFRARPVIGGLLARMLLETE